MSIVPLIFLPMTMLEILKKFPSRHLESNGCNLYTSTKNHQRPAKTTNHKKFIIYREYYFNDIDAH